MRVELRDEYRRKIGRINIDPELSPTRVTIEGEDTEVFLTWDTARDDSGQLRRCISCGCNDMFVEKAFPQVTGFVVVLAFAGFFVGALGYATTPPVLIAMATVLVLDLAIYVYSRLRLVCYQCRSSYHELPIARYHKPWDRAMADRHAPPDEEATDQEPAS